MKKRILALLLVAAFVFAGCSNSESNETAVNITNEITIGQESSAEVPSSDAAPSTDASGEPEKYYLTFNSTTTDGGTWTSDNFANSRLTMINIWGTYCSPCLNEMPDLGEIATEYDAADFQLIGVICDVMEDADEKTLENAKELIEKTKANYPHLLLSESLYMNLVGAVSAVPTTFFVSQDGAVMGYLTGAQSKENWKSLIDQLLAEMEQ